MFSWLNKCYQFWMLFYYLIHFKCLSNEQLELYNSQISILKFKQEFIDNGLIFKFVSIMVSYKYDNYYSYIYLDKWQSFVNN